MLRKALSASTGAVQANEAAGGPPVESMPPAEARQAAVEALRETAFPPEEVYRVENMEVPCAGHAVPVRVYTPAAPALSRV